MRIVLDTNILARTFIGPYGPAGELFRLICTGHTLVLSPFLIMELDRVLRYERMIALHGKSEERIDAHVNDICQAGEMVIPQTISAVVPTDPDDDAVIATAIVGKADVLCTLDRHLRTDAVKSYCEQRGLKVMTDVELLEALRKV